MILLRFNLMKLKVTIHDIVCVFYNELERWLVGPNESIRHHWIIEIPINDLDLDKNLSPSGECLTS